MTNRQTTFELYKIDKDDVKKSSEWFNEQVRNLSNKRITPRRILQENGVNVTNRVVPGRLYFFFYDPKGKDTLPYYDTFPLVLPFGKTTDSFIGLNLHYLDYKMRMALFNELMKVNGNKALTPNSKIRYSWDTVKSMAKLAPGKACVKMYLNEQMKSPFVEIPPEYWHTAIMLPVQRFVGVNKETVWNKNRKYK